MATFSIHSLWKDWKEVVYFLGKVVLIYGTWRIIRYFGDTYPNFLFGGWAAAYEFVAQKLVQGASIILTVLGYTHEHYGRILIIEGTRGIRVENLCVGFPSFFIFSGLILGFGNNWRDKIWYIPLGVSLIYLINIGRILALALFQIYSTKYFDLAHNYFYVYITYALIFILVAFWMEKLAYKKHNISAS
ncbi:MAG: archaeosortase/exosortase family protein [Chitinophagales bacterium]|nr:archaeosortase/exosortase family protein [Chitinophagales bacterium]OJV26413.1 MAG: hypothetical protein BGO32_12465 [Bacteroidetes bacterium 37-13]HRN94913.1 exosortase/archaeosortase family protein [Chitinophagales bacterium]HRP39423.1 exosortase/archaeosortase family protein [Chitinophagales bacterium]